MFICQRKDWVMLVMFIKGSSSKEVDWMEFTKAISTLLNTRGLNDSFGGLNGPGVVSILITVS